MSHRLRLLGGARLDRDGTPVAGRAAHRRRLALLALLSATPGRRLTRERILAYLWPEADSDAGRRSLSEAVYAIRQEVGDEALVSVGDEITLDPAHVPSDLDELELACEAGDAEGVGRLYVGPFLDGWYVDKAPAFDRWAEEQRERVRQAVLRSLRDCAIRRQNVGDWTSASQLWRQAARIDPFASSVARNLAASLANAGERAEALLALTSHRTRLREELDVEPDDETVRLERQLKAEVVAERTVSRKHESIAPMSDTSVQSAVKDGVTSEPSLPQAARWPKWRWVSVAVGLPTLAALGAAYLNRTASVEHEASATIAIMTFRHTNADSSLRFIAEDLSRGLIDQLGVNAFRVVPSTEIHAVGANRRALDSMLVDRNVGFLVEGTIARQQGLLRANVHFVRASNREPLASGTFVRPPSELFEVESDVLRFVVDALRQQLRRAVSIRDASEEKRDALARKLALAAFRRREDATSISASDRPLDGGVARELLWGADSLLVRALEVEPGWTKLWTSRAQTMLELSRLEHGATRITLLERGLTFANRAVAHSPQDAAALEVRGTLHWALAARQARGGHDTTLLRRAETDLRSAVSLEPSRSLSWLTMSYVQMVRGQPGAARNSVEHARENDALLVDREDTYFMQFASAMGTGALAEADRWCRVGRIAFPRDPRFVECSLTIMRERPGDSRHARDAWAAVAVLDSMDRTAGPEGRHPFSTTYRRLVAAAVSARSGDPVRARSELSELRRAAGRDSGRLLEMAFDEAFVHLALGDTARAIELLRTLLVEKPTYRRVLENAPLFSSIRETIVGSQTTSTAARIPP